MEEIFIVAEYLIYGLLALAMGLSVYTARKFSSGALSVLFSSFAYSVFFIAVYFVFMRLSEDGGYYSDVSLHVWAHVIVYFSMISLIWGAYQMRQVAEHQDMTAGHGYAAKKNAFYWSLIALMVLALLFSFPLETVFSSFLTGSVIDVLGLHHFSVFVLGAVSAWYLHRLKGDWGLLASSLSFFIGFLCLIGLQHLWETLTESWRVVVLDTVFIEGVEMLIIAPALILLCISQWKVVKFIRG